MTIAFFDNYYFEKYKLIHNNLLSAGLGDPDDGEFSMKLYDHFGDELNLVESDGYMRDLPRRATFSKRLVRISTPVRTVIWYISLIIIAERDKEANYNQALKDVKDGKIARGKKELKEQ